MSKDTISRQAAIEEFQTEWSCFVYGRDACKAIISRLKQLPSAQPEYTENEEKVLVMMFTIVKNILDLQDGYMNIDDTSFGRNELFYLSEKLGIDY